MSGDAEATTPRFQVLVRDNRTGECTSIFAITDEHRFWVMSIVGTDIVTQGDGLPDYENPTSNTDLAHVLTFGLGGLQS